MPYIKSHSNYVLSKKHQSVSDGTIYERDITTIGGVNQFAVGQVPIYRSNNFIITVRNDSKVMNQYNSGKWVENEDGDIWTLQTLSSMTNDVEEQNDIKIVLKKDYYDFRDFAYYGSLSELFRSSLNDVFMRFPGELFITENDKVYYTSSHTENLSDTYVEEFLFESEIGDDPTHYVSNPYGIDIHSIVKPSDGKPIKFFAEEGYKNYRIIQDDIEVDISHWQSTLTENEFCKGNKIADIDLSGGTETSAPIIVNIEAYVGDNNEIVYLSKNGNTHIRPKEKFITEFYNGCNTFEKLLLDDTTTPKYKSMFSVITENEYGYYRKMEEFIFPTSYGGYNLDAESNSYNDFSKRLAEIGEYYDEYFTDNLYRSMTHESIKNFDWTYTREFNEGDEEEYRIGGEKVQKALRIFAREFDEILSYVNEIKNNNKITYDDKNNIPNYFLADAASKGGWDIKLVYPYNLDEYYFDNEGHKTMIQPSSYTNQNQLDNKYNGEFLFRQFSQNTTYEIVPYSKEYLGEYENGYFNTCSGETVPSTGETMYYDEKYDKVYFRIKPYTSEKLYSYFDANNEFLKRLAINSPYIWRKKGTIEGIESILSLFGMKSKRWVDIYGDTALTADYDVIEYSSLTKKIEETWDDEHQMYRIDWVNSTKAINYTYGSRFSNNGNGTNYYEYIPYQGLTVAYVNDAPQYEVDESSLLNKPYLKYDATSGQIPTSSETEAFKDSNNEPVRRRYLYPSFSKYEQIDGNPYFQMDGGWLAKTIVSGETIKYNFQYDVDDNIAYTEYKDSDTEDNSPLFKETIRNIRRVETINDLITTPLAALKEDTIYYVSNVEHDIAIINNAVYKIYYEYEYAYPTTSASTKPLMYVILRKENGNIKVGDGTYFDESIVVYSKYPKLNSTTEDSNDENQTANETESYLVFGDYELIESSFSLSDKANGYELKAYVGFDEVNKQYYFVCKDTTNGSYSIDSFVVLDAISKPNSTNYFLLHEPYYGNRLAGENDTYGWIRLCDTDPQYIKINTIKNYYEGNNPHNGNMDYDLGHKYFLYYKQLFKYAIEQYLFDERCYNNFQETLEDEIYKYGFSGLVNDDESIKQYAEKMIVDTKIHYFGNYYASNNHNCKNIMYYGNNQETKWRLEKMYGNNIKVSAYTLYDNEYMIGGSPYASSEDNGDPITNQIVNNKRMTIKFFLHNEWYTNEGQTELKYIDDIVLHYLTQVIPSTTIVDVQYVSK